MTTSPLRARIVTGLAVVALAVSLALSTVGASAPATAADGHCNPSGESRQPVLLVHGFNSGPGTWNAKTQAKYAKAGATCIDVFDYKSWSTQWVTDEHIGPALAARIEQLAAASANGKGSGKVIIVAHSMGGLATRCAVASSCNGGLRGVSAHVLELITFDTPNTGTYLRGSGVGYQAMDGVMSLVSGACYTSFLPHNPICEFIRALFTSDATKAFTPGSAALRSLPRMPNASNPASDVTAIPVLAVAGHVELATTVFGREVNLGGAGDLIVKENSALDEGLRVHGLGGKKTIDCGKLNVLSVSAWNRLALRVRALPKCTHITETNDMAFTSAALAEIGTAVRQQPRRPPPTTPTAPPAPPPPATSQAPVDAFSPGSRFDDYCYVAWPTAPSYTSTSIQMTMSCNHVPQSKFLLTQVVYDDPQLRVTPSTGRMHVTGTVLDTARSAMGYDLLMVHATTVS